MADTENKALEMLQKIEADVQSMDKAIIDSKSQGDGLSKDIETLKAEYQSELGKVDESYKKLSKDMNKLKQAIKSEKGEFWTKDLKAEAKDFWVDLFKNYKQNGSATKALTINGNSEPAQTSLIDKLNERAAQFGVAERYCTIVRQDDAYPYLSSADNGTGFAWVPNDASATINDMSGDITYSKSTITPIVLGGLVLNSFQFTERASIDTAAHMFDRLLSARSRKLDNDVMNADGGNDTTDGGFTGVIANSGVVSTTGPLDLSAPNITLLRNMQLSVHESVIPGENDVAYYANWQDIIQAKSALVNSEANHFVWVPQEGVGINLMLDGVPVRAWNTLTHAATSITGSWVYGDLRRAVTVVIGNSLDFMVNPYRLRTTGLIEYSILGLAGHAVVEPTYLTKLATQA